ncbi:hypothetical protein FRC02_008752 [Tulasnella sp. 418]|nr:hypothetical protein FRC02_008752 [Tulasnella sp. 418]
MPLPDERPRASVANLIGRFEQHNQKIIRRASSHSSDLNAKAAAPGSPSTAEPPRTFSKGPAPSWLKRKETEEKEKNKVENVDVPTADATRDNPEQAPSPPVQSPPIEPVEPNPQSLPSPPPEPAEEPKEENKATESNNAPIATKPTATRSAFVATKANTASKQSPTVNALKTSKSVSSLKPKAAVPSSFRAPAVPSVPPPLKPQHTGPSGSGSTIPPLRPQLTGGSTTSTPRRTVSTTFAPPRAKTPSAVSRPKTPSARAPKLPPPSTHLHAPTAASLARAKTPVSGAPREGPTTPSKKSTVSKSTTTSPTSKLSPVALGTSGTSKVGTKSPLSSTSSNRRLVSVPKAHAPKPQTGVLKKAPGTIVAKVKNLPMNDSSAAPQGGEVPDASKASNEMEVRHPEVVVQPATPTVNTYENVDKPAVSDAPEDPVPSKEEVSPEADVRPSEQTISPEVADEKSDSVAVAPEQPEEHKEEAAGTAHSADDEDDLDKMVSMLEAKPKGLVVSDSDEPKDFKAENVPEIADE